MRVYYDCNLDQLVLVTHRPSSGLYIYSTDILWEHTEKSPKYFECLVELGDFLSGDIYEQD